MTNQNNAAQAANKEIREAFELSYAMDADDPASATELSHFTNGWRACIMSQVGKPVVMKLAVDATAAIDLINATRRGLRAPVADERAAFKKCHSTIIKALAAIAMADGPDTRHEDDPELLYRSPVMDDVVRIRVALDECSAALASAPVAGERALFALKHIGTWAGIGAGMKTHKEVREYAKHNAHAGAPCSCPSGDGSLRHPCAVHPPVDKASEKPAHDERQAWAADMVAAGAKHLGDECWEWESDDFLFHLWQVATGRQYRAARADADKKEM